ncbi:uncharacterized protein LOC136085717 [Hydra vulgaris]|uniref:Uncharacterized protein LOC136085717 n=1 Tax=Hydra vulgaris TaxID=6087 RepID=A0ABM4CMT1_HYDVU
MDEQINLPPSYFEVDPPPPYETIYQNEKNIQSVVVDIEPNKANQNVVYSEFQSAQPQVELEYPPACTCLAWSSFFFGFFPIGAFAIYYSYQVKSATEKKELDQAVKAYSLTRKLAFWSFFAMSTFLLILLIGFFFVCFFTRTFVFIYYLIIHTVIFLYCKARKV